MIKAVTALSVALLAGAACGGSPAGSKPVLAEFHTGRHVGPPLVAGAAVWVANEADGTVSRIDPASNRVVATIRVGDPAVMVAGGCGAGSTDSFMRDSLLNRRCDLPSSLAYDGHSIWAADNASESLARIDPRTNRVVRRVAIGADPFALGWGFGSLWVTSYFGPPQGVLRVDPASGKVIATIGGPPMGGTGIALGAGAVWVAGTYSQTLARIDPTTNRLTAVIPVERYPLAVAAGRRMVWVRNEDSSSVSRIDPNTNRVAATAVGLSAPAGSTGDDALALTSEGLWAASFKLYRIDPAHGRVTATIDVSGSAVSAGFGSLWLTSVFGTVQRIDPSSAVAVSGK
ncbi:MAG: YncE family protein [Candidatus Dormibacteraeota bacterium]|nr:YncE family protein [Candidatus Dormibacteraeota bacterium]